VNVFNAQERGIWLQGGREIQIDNCHIQGARKQGLFVDSHTDAKIHRIVANGNSGTEAGIELSSAGNSQITDCKVFYRGNGSSNVAAPGFRINSSRITIANCQAQDNGGYGFIFEGLGGDHTATNLLADSNGAQGSVTGGFYIEVPGVYSAMHALDRDQSTQRQTRGFVFGNTPKVYLTGRGQTPAGTNITVNSPHADSYVRLLREGSSLYSVG
jgi:Right handed beta helix region